MSDIIKSGNLLKFSDGSFNAKWKYNYVELFQNSTFRWYEKKGDSCPKRTVNLKNVSAYLAFGEIVKQLPFKPDLKPDQINLVIAIPHENSRNTRLSFFLCGSEPEIRDWVNTILNTVTDSLPDKSNPQVTGDQSHITPMTSGGMLGGPPQSGAPYSGPSQSGAPYGGPPQSGAPYGGPPQSGAPYGGPPQSGAPYGGPPQTGAPYGGPPQSGAPYGGPPQMGAPYGGPPQSGAPYGGPQQSGVPYGGPPQSGAPYGGPPYGGPPPYYSAPGQSSGGPPIGFNIGNGPSNYSPGNPPGSYPVSYPNSVPNNTNYQYPRMPQNQPIGTSTNYQPGIIQTTNYPRQPGYVPGVTQPYATNQAAPTYVIVDGKKKKKHSKIKNAAIGIAAGAATAYAANKMFGGHHYGYGHGWGHGYGHGWGHGWGGMHYGGSWSSLSSGSWSD